MGLLNEELELRLVKVLGILFTNGLNDAHDRDLKKIKESGRLVEDADMIDKRRMDLREGLCARRIVIDMANTPAWLVTGWLDYKSERSEPVFELILDTGGSLSSFENQMNELNGLDDDR